MMRLGMGTRLATTATATGSVGESTAARAKATPTGMAGISQCSSSPMPRTVQNTRPKASSRMVDLSRSRSSLEMRQPSRNSRGGRNSRKNTSGLSSIRKSVAMAMPAPRAICTSGRGSGSGEARTIMLLTTTASSIRRITVRVVMRAVGR